MRLRRFMAVVVKELRQVARDRMTLALMFGLPALQLVLFGYAINLDVRGLGAATADLADTVGSRSLVADLHATLCYALGIDHTKEVMTSLGRPVQLVDKGEPVTELF